MPACAGRRARRYLTRGRRVPSVSPLISIRLSADFPAAAALFRCSQVADGLRGSSVEGPMSAISARFAGVRRSAAATIQPQGHVFYGWWIVLAGAGIQVLGGALLQSA